MLHNGWNKWNKFLPSKSTIWHTVPSQRLHQRWRFPESLKQHVGRLGKFEWQSLAYLPKEIKYFAIVMVCLTTWLLFINLRKKARKSQRTVMLPLISLQLDNQNGNSTERKAVIKVQLLIVVLGYGLFA